MQPSILPKFVQSGGAADEEINLQFDRVAKDLLLAVASNPSGITGTWKNMSGVQINQDEYGLFLRTS